MARRSARIDDNQNEIVQALRAIGCSVVSLAAVGKGCPDIAVGIRGKTFLLEIKDGRKVPSARKLTESEQKFHDGWRGHIATVESADQAINAVLTAEIPFA